MMIDDAHSSGVLGRTGRGTVDHYKVHGRVDVQVGTLSKAIGALGGYVCGSKDLIDFLYHRGSQDTSRCQISVHVGPWPSRELTARTWPPVPTD